MQYLQLDTLKRQCIVDEDFHDDDQLLIQYGAAAESLAAEYIGIPLEAVVDQNCGQLPPILESAMCMVVDYLYSAQRGSGASDKTQLPECIYTFFKLFRHYL